MNKKMILLDFSKKLIKQKRKIRSIQYLMKVSFICLSTGILLSLPLRYYFALDYKIPLILLFLTLIMTFVYGLLGIERSLDALKDADEKLEYDEKLSAAYQFAESDNPYSQLLLNDAYEIIKNLSPSKVYSVRISRRDIFQPFLLALFLFFWMSSFSFLEINSANQSLGELLIETSTQIDAVNSETDEKDIKDISEEYKKLGKRIQDQFMNDRAIENEVEKLSRKLEKITEELSRDGVEKESRLLSGNEAESEIFQLNRKKAMSEDLNEILKNLLNTFSNSPGAGSGGISRTDGEFTKEQSLSQAEDPEETQSGEGSSRKDISPLDEETGETGETNKNSDENTSLGSSKNTSENDENKEAEENGSDITGDTGEDDSPGTADSEALTKLQPFIEKKQSGEFDEESIDGEFRDGEQMKSFIRALPHMVDPTMEDLDVIHFYRNQLETSIEREILPESYQTIVRDYFLSIGVLNE